MRCHTRWCIGKKDHIIDAATVSKRWMSEYMEGWQVVDSQDIREA